MNDFGNEFILTPTMEDLSFLDPEKKLGLHPLTSETAKQISSMTSSTHEVEIAVGPHDEFVLVKTFAVKDAESLAQNELAILSSLPETSTVQFPTLHSPTIARNRDGNPVLLVDFEPAYIPLSSMQQMLKEELKTDEPNKTITGLIDGIREMHELGIFHNDLHDNNIGMGTD